MNDHTCLMTQIHQQNQECVNHHFPYQSFALKYCEKDICCCIRF
jgi:hypothetical protein